MMNEPVTLTNCDREPIHLIGAIQDFGSFLALNGDWNVAHRSVNLAEMLDLDELPAVGTDIRTVFQEEALKTLRSAVSVITDGDEVERLFGLDLCGTGSLFDAAIHISGSLIIFEFEPHSHGELDRGLAMLRPVMKQLEKETDSDGLFRQAVRHLASVLDYDRVLLYRFQEDGSGHVVAEHAGPDIGSYLDLRFPRADIPVQARALLLRNRFRIIGDMDAAPVPIEPARTIKGEPLDLSMSTLRSHSTMHVEYMKNMGVQSSLTIAIIVRGKLWGMFACHHYKPRVLPYSRRTVAELFCELFSLVVERMLTREEGRLDQLGRQLHDHVLRSFAAGASLRETLPSLLPIIARVIPHDGVTLYSGKTYTAIGKAPEEADFLKILPALNSAASSEVIVSEALADRIPEAEAFAGTAAGAMILPVSRSPNDYLVLWRSEQIQNVTWAGEPTKIETQTADGVRLSPRKSFEAWQDTVRGKSERWTDKEARLAENLRVSLLEVILKLTDEAMQVQIKAQQQQELLIAELNHRVRNILNLIRGLINQSRGETMDIENFAEMIGGRINALASAHDNITKENWSPASLRELFNTEADAYLSGKLDRLNIIGNDALIAPEAYTVLALVIHEMITNSAKYGALCDQKGTLTITIECTEEDGLTIGWCERDGPEVTEPTRRGFGSTIIEKSIPYELKGKTEIRYPHEGLEAEFFIPANFVTCVDAKQTRQQIEDAAEKSADDDGDVAPPQSVLLVEDSMIIALDTQDCLEELGVDRVDIESTVAGALTQLKKQRYDMALLDFNLGSETSEKVAESLRKHGIPFWLATGYGEMDGKVEKFGAQGMLVKPYGRDDLNKALVAFARLPG